MNLFLLYKKGGFLAAEGSMIRKFLLLSVLRLAEHIVFLRRVFLCRLESGLEYHSVWICALPPTSSCCFKETITHTFRKSRCTGVRYPWQRRLSLPLRQLFFTPGRNIPGSISGHLLCCFGWKWRFTSWSRIVSHQLLSGLFHTTGFK